MFPVDQSDQVVDLLGGIKESGPYAYELTGNFTNGATIVARVNFDVTCTWKPITSH